MGTLGHGRARERGGHLDVDVAPKIGDVGWRVIQKFSTPWTSAVRIIISVGKSSKNPGTAYSGFPDVRHDKWGTHSHLGVPSYATPEAAHSGNYYGAISFMLADGNYYTYVDGGAGSEAAESDNLSGWNNYYLQSGSGPWYGEGFNSRGRPTFGSKMPAAELANFLDNH
jgi:hypothetical protein